MTTSLPPTYRAASFAIARHTQDESGVNIKTHTALSALTKESSGAINIAYTQHDGEGGAALEKSASAWLKTDSSIPLF